MTRILIADDHDVVRTGLHAILSGQSGWAVVAEAAHLADREQPFHAMVSAHFVGS